MKNVTACLHEPGDGLNEGHLGAAPAELIIEGSHEEAKHRGVVLGVGEVRQKRGPYYVPAVEVAGPLAGFRGSFCHISRFVQSSQSSDTG